MRSRETSLPRATVTAAALLLLAACSTPSSRPPSAAHSSGPGATALVTGRSVKPTDLEAPGLAFTKGDLSFEVGNHRIVISASEWNTVVAGSAVRDLVGSMIDPAFDGTDVTRNRFQYLADRIAQYATTGFEPIGLAEGTGTGQFIEFAALYNSTAQVKKLSGLTVSIIDQSKARTVATQTFYATPGSALVLPAHTIYFARLSFAQFARTSDAEGNSVIYSIHFHFDHFIPCNGQVCAS